LLSSLSNPVTHAIVCMTVHYFQLTAALEKIIAALRRVA